MISETKAFEINQV